MFGGALPILHVCTFSWKYFFFTKRERREEIKKTVVYVRGGYSTRHSPEVWEHPQENALRCMCIREPPLQPYSMVKEVDKHMAWTQECMKVKHG